MQAFRKLLSCVLIDVRIPNDDCRAYILATVKHECAGTWEPIIERGSPEYFKKYEGLARIGNTVPGDGLKYIGRGFSMLTGRANYEKFEKRLGIPLVAKPEKACEWDVAYEILVIGMMDGLFTGVGLKKLSTKPTDFVAWRTTVNGTDRAQLIAGYAANMKTLLSTISRAA